MNHLARECKIFTRYLISELPSEYVLEKYEAYHTQPTARLFQLAGLFDRNLLAFARLHPIATQLADSYSRCLCCHSALRKKLFLTLAILESCAPSYRSIDAVDPGGRYWLIAKMLLRAALAAGVLLLSVLLLLPCHLVCSLAQRLFTADSVTRPN